MTEEELRARTKAFGLRVMALAAALPVHTIGKIFVSQLVRSGTSVGANYRAACRARSKAEFVSKLGIAEEEADESAYWLELVIEGKLMRPKLVLPLLDEANQLLKIMISSRMTALQGSGAKSKIDNQKSKM